MCRMDFRSNDMLENVPSTSAFALAHNFVQENPQVTETMVFDTNTSNNTTTAANTIVNDQPSPEYLQRKLYFLLEHLKKMHSELPE